MPVHYWLADKLGCATGTGNTAGRCTTGGGQKQRWFTDLYYAMEKSGTG